MSTDENVKLVKNVFAAMGSSDARDLLALVAEGWPLAGTHRGHAELAAVCAVMARHDVVPTIIHFLKRLPPMTSALNDQSLDQIFRSARTPNGWADRPVGDDLVREIYDLLKWGPTSANSSPARFVWVRSPDGKARLAGLAAEPNRPKILKAPVTVIIGHDLDFAGELPKLLPHAAEVMQKYFAAPDVAEVTAIRNGTLQGAYLIVAARALGLDCGPMSGFDNAGVDKAFFSGTRVRSNFICSIGHGDPASVFPRNPRLGFEEASRWA